ncbi:MotA/TolQ/ExbB proton channel family protein [Parasedimentitalea huanghaiensis]|uniref:MotA/TolQ/ExbB proton channel domain-containing protein n=1 Tax=Parasedimentitalea huanghaiensis TaxID=2682100 RepID=A0A6L6WLM0_9RHOB|nr:MotA/TolQ/ExbB proton channel family protein [Zongyanglinia huanghaiensis]MVO18371.1 hypothetical protein [Zongyanglinia huanghaiensis]
MAQKPSRIHSVAPKVTLDRAAFVLAFLFGVFGGVLIKFWGAHPFFAASYSAAILIFYAFVSWAGGRVKIEPETIGDNCYYLGFLFTLASLSYTLYQMAEPGGGVDTAQVISGFGVALSSTIMGVFLRVFMMQSRSDFVAKDREVRADVNKSFGDFKKNMSGILAQMKAFSTESIQYAAERDERLRTSTEDFIKDYHSDLSKASESLSKAMEKTFSEAATKAVEEISTSVRESNKKSQEALTELVGSIQQLKTELQEQEAQSFEEIQSRRKRTIKELEEAEKRLKAHGVAMEGYIKITRRASDAMTKRLVPSLDAFRERLDKLPPEEEVHDAPFLEPGEGVENPPQIVDRPFVLMASRKGLKSPRKGPRVKPDVKTDAD